MIVLPKIGPPVRQVESYPLGDYLYDRAKSGNDLILAQLRWQRFVRGLPEADREAVEKVERIFRKKVSELPLTGG